MAATLPGPLTHCHLTPPRGKALQHGTSMLLCVSTPVPSAYRHTKAREHNQTADVVQAEDGGDPTLAQRMPTPRTCTHPGNTQNMCGLVPRAAMPQCRNMTRKASGSSSDEHAACKHACLPTESHLHRCDCTESHGRVDLHNIQPLSVYKSTHTQHTRGTTHI